MQIPIALWMCLYITHHKSYLFIRLSHWLDDALFGGEWLLHIPVYPWALEHGNRCVNVVRKWMQQWKILFKGVLGISLGSSTKDRLLSDRTSSPSLTKLSSGSQLGSTSSGAKGHSPKAELGLGAQRFFWRTSRLLFKPMMMVPHKRGGDREVGFTILSWAT